MKKEKSPSNETHQILSFNLKNKWGKQGQAPSGFTFFRVYDCE